MSILPQSIYRLNAISRYSFFLLYKLKSGFFHLCDKRATYSRAVGAMGVGGHGGGLRQGLQRAATEGPARLCPPVQQEMAAFVARRANL